MIVYLFLAAKITKNLGDAHKGSKLIQSLSESGTDRDSAQKWSHWDSRKDCRLGLREVEFLKAAFWDFIESIAEIPAKEMGPRMAS